MSEDIPDKDEAFIQCCFNAGSTSATLTQHWFDISYRPGLVRIPVLFRRFSVSLVVSLEAGTGSGGH